MPTQPILRPGRGRFTSGKPWSIRTPYVAPTSPTGSLTPPVVWQPVNDTPLLIDGQRVLTVPLGTTNLFYTLGLD